MVAVAVVAVGAGSARAGREGATVEGEGKRRWEVDEGERVGGGSERGGGGPTEASRERPRAPTPVPGARPGRDAEALLPLAPIPTPLPSALRHAA